MNFNSDLIESLIDKDNLQFKVGEGDIEFKSEFNITKLYKILVAMSNGDGGLLIYGVNDNGFIEGVKDLSVIPDISIITQFCTSHFSERIRFEVCSYSISEKTIYAFYVHAKSIAIYAVCTKDGAGITDGDVYIRRSGITEKIKGHELARYLNKIYQKHDGGLTELEKKALIVKHEPRIRNGRCNTSQQQISLFVKNEGADAEIIDISSDSTDISVDWKGPTLIENGKEVWLPIFNKTTKPASILKFELDLNYTDKLGHKYQVHIKCNGAQMTFERPVFCN